jgi:hypothetical protein
MARIWFLFKWFLAMCFWWWCLPHAMEIRAERILADEWPTWGWVITGFFWTWAIGSTCIFIGGFFGPIAAPALSFGQKVAAFAAGFLAVRGGTPGPKK